MCGGIKNDLLRCRLWMLAAWDGFSAVAKGLSVAEESSALITRFSAGFDNPGL